jgi:protocatechuate 3,4-dioxygenase beta subunit
MESWALVADHPYYAITDEKGQFTLTDIPPGTYRVAVWHPYLREPSTHEVTIKAKDSTSLAVTIPAPTGRLYANQMVENPYIRYNITDEVQSSIIPTLEKQQYQ